MPNKEDTGGESTFSLRDKLGERGYIDYEYRTKSIAQEEIARHNSKTTELVEERFEKRLIEETSKLDKSLSNKITDLSIKISDTRSEMIKWMFIFWAGGLAIIVGTIISAFIGIIKFLN